MANLDLQDIQGIVASGYGNMRAASFSLLFIEDASAARAWLRNLADTVPSAQSRASEQAVHVAFTAKGLRRIGLPEDVIEQFSLEFREGMVTPHRSRILGDIGLNDPSSWRWGGPASQPVDLLLMLYAAQWDILAELEGRLVSSLASSGLSLLRRLETSDLDDTEHFGFRDGISQPSVEGLNKPGLPRDTIEPGEVLLGYRNEYGLYSDRPTLANDADPRRLLPRAESASGRADFGRNGTYLVLRQMTQDVRAFWRFMYEATRGPDGTHNSTEAIRLASKMVGRWPSGAPLTGAPHADNEALGDFNDFAYHDDDADGLACPVGSHVRRTNPRDSLPPSPGSERSIDINKRHRILRRGREYGPALSREDAVASAPDDEPERGLNFVCLNANLARQFEFIQHTWANNPHFEGLYDDSDPITGLAPAPYGRTFTVPELPIRQRVCNVPQFVTVIGGAYFFLPGIRALRYLASLG